MSVKEGDEVNAGEVIGAVGDTAQAEVAELSHLHFGLKKNGQWIDLSSLLTLLTNKLSSFWRFCNTKC